jgi:hypothetical protein
MWLLYFPFQNELMEGGLRYAASKGKHEALSAVGAP